MQHWSNWGALCNSTLLIRQASRQIHNRCRANMWINYETIMNPFLRAHQSFSKWSCCSQKIVRMWVHAMGWLHCTEDGGFGWKSQKCFECRWLSNLQYVMLTFLASLLAINKLLQTEPFFYAHDNIIYPNLHIITVRFINTNILSVNAFSMCRLC